jgi:hypothetical protein
LSHPSRLARAGFSRQDCGIASRRHKSRPALRRRGYALVIVMGALALVLVASLTQLSVRLAAIKVAQARMDRALARQAAVVALSRALLALADGPGLDTCATASATLVPGADPRRTLCMGADGSLYYLVSGLPSPASPDAAESVELAKADAAASFPAVTAPLETERDAAGRTLAKTAWWASDEGVKAPYSASDWRSSSALYPDEADSAAAEASLRAQIPCLHGTNSHPEALRTQRSLFTLANSLDGGLREDLSALESDEAASFAFPPPQGWQAWMRSRYPVGGAMATDPGAARIEPVIAEFAFVCGIAANADGVKDKGLADILLSWHLFVEIWNPYARPLAYGGTAPDIRVVVRNLPRLDFGSLPGGPTAALPDPVTIDLDCWNDLAEGGVQLLAEPASGGGVNGTGVWHTKIGTVRLNTNSLKEAFALGFSATSPVVEFYDLNASSSAPFFTMKLEGVPAFSIAYGAGNKFFRSASNTTSYGMGREAANAGGWAFSWHMRLRDEELLKLLTKSDLHSNKLDLPASSGGDEYHEVLNNPAEYDRDAALRPGDFFASNYSGPPWGNRRAILFDPPAGRVLSLAALLQAPGTALPDAADRYADLDRYFFSGLAAGEWNGVGASPDGRALPAEKGLAVTRAPGDAATFLLSGGWNLNTADARVWTALLRSFAESSLAVTDSSGKAATIPLEAPFYAFPFSAGHPATDAVAAILTGGDVSACDGAAANPYEDRDHPAYLLGLRDLGAEADALGVEIAARMAARGTPFRSLSEFAESRLLQEAIDAVLGINRRSGGVDGIPEGSPANVTQERLLAALSPILFTRSDTFVLRFYGRDEASGAEALGEALVQRLPTPVEGDASKGREFKVVFVRWLAASER